VEARSNNARSESSSDTLRKTLHHAAVHCPAGIAPATPLRAFGSTHGDQTAASLDTGAMVRVNVTPMNSPSASAAPGAPAPKAAPSTATSAPPAAEAQIKVHRPAPGLGRGAFEAPPWAFYGLLGALIVATVAYVGHRLGWFRRSSKDPAS
jgi:uncharacterized protein involved in copper resistance